MSKAIPSWKVIINLKPSKDEKPATEHTRAWYSYDEWNAKRPPVPEVHLCGPVKIGSSLEFAVCNEEEAHSLASHMERSGFVDDYTIIRI